MIETSGQMKEMPGQIKEKSEQPVLLFDFGGVLVNLDRSRVEQAFDLLGFNIRPFLGTYKQSGVFEQLEQGKITVDGFCEQLRGLAHNDNLNNEDIIAAWQSFLTDVPAERLELLLKIRQHYSVNLLSNTNRVHWSMAESRFFRYKGLTVSHFFDHTFLSCELGVEKPAPLIFQKVIEGLKVPANNILFFDDSETNCEAARNSGMNALLAGPNSDWFKYFDENGKLYASYIQ